MLQSESSRVRIRVLVVDDHEVVREGLRAILPEKGYEVVGVAASGADALACARDAMPDVVLVDLRLPDMSGEDLCRSLRQDFPDLAIVVLTTYVSEDTVRRALQAGATGYVTKAAGITELLSVLELLASGEGVEGDRAAPQIVKKLHDLIASRTATAPVTPQQESVLEFAAQGLTNREIGERLFISESTVRFHLQKLKAKFGARNKGDLIAITIRRGVISPADDDASQSSS